jgi:hypothetical protein
MPTNNRKGRGGDRGRSGRNNNPDGRNQYGGVMGTARGNPLATAASVGGAVAAGVFLWSRRSQVIDQMGNLADRFSEAREGMRSDGRAALKEDLETTSTTQERGDGRSQREIAEEALTLKETGVVA